MFKKDIICIGASAGGVEALLQLINALPLNFQAAVFVVVHVPAEPPSVLHEILGRQSKIPVVQAQDGAKIEQGTVYVAQSDMHLILENGVMRVIHGPKENRFRPAIDPLFRSAALVYTSRVIGVILTGLLDDGTSGLSAVKSAGGIAVVQDPSDALYPSMPLSALKKVEVDHVVPLSGMAAVLQKAVEMPANNENIITNKKRIQAETEIVKMDGNAMEKTREIGKPSAFACPECHGTLWEIDDPGMLRFRCHVGHAYTASALQADQVENLEDKLWAAVAALDENALLLRRMAFEKIDTENLSPDECEEQAHKAEENSELLRSIIAKRI